jgi:hypothetical protein
VARYTTRWSPTKRLAPGERLAAPSQLAWRYVGPHRADRLVPRVEEGRLVFLVVLLGFGLRSYVQRKEVSDVGDAVRNDEEGGGGREMWRSVDPREAWALLQRGEVRLLDLVGCQNSVPPGNQPHSHGRSEFWHPTGPRAGCLEQVVREYRQPRVNARGTR